MTGNQGSIPEREPERWLPLPRKAAGAQITQSRLGEVVTGHDGAGRLAFCDWVEEKIKRLTRNDWRASLVPAAAVIPAPMVYIKVVAVERLVVGRRGGGSGAGRPVSGFGVLRGARGNSRAPPVTVRKLECSRQACAWIG